MIHVPIQWRHRYGDKTPCFGHLADHVPQPLPCKNGADERHHPYAPPKSVILDIAGQRRRVRLSR